MLDQLVGEYGDKNRDKARPKKSRIRNLHVWLTFKKSNKKVQKSERHRSILVSVPGQLLVCGAVIS